MTDLYAYVVDPFQYGFMQRAFIVALIISLTCPLVGVFVVTRGFGFMGDAMAHSIFPGMVAALVLGLSPWLGMIPAALVFSFFIGILVRKTGLQADAAIGIMFATMFALGIIMISLFASRVSVNLEDILLGQILAVSEQDIWVTMGATALTLFVFAGFYKDLMFVSFDALGAEIAGMRVVLLDYLLIGLISLVVVVTIQAVGVILVLAMLVAPSAAATLATRKIHHVILLGIGFALASSIIGLYFSYYANLPSGASIAFTSGVIFGAVALLRNRVALMRRT